MIIHLHIALSEASNRAMFIIKLKSSPFSRQKSLSKLKKNSSSVL